MAEVDICTICRSNLRDDRDFVTTACGHEFHTQCIATNAATTNNKCPICRQPIPSFPNIFTGYQSTKEVPEKKAVSNEVNLFLMGRIFFISLLFFC